MENGTVKGMLFDVFGTVVDWRRGIARDVAAYFAPRDLAVDADAFADAWRAQYQPSMEKVREGARGYVPLEILHLENLEVTLDAFDLSGKVDEAGRTELNKAWNRLPPWPDSVAGLTSLKARYAIATCSNGSIALMLALARYGGLPWDALLGAEIAQSYKPMPGVYLASAAAMGFAPGEVMMVAAHNDDLDAAQSAGLRTAFVHRPTEHGPEQATDLEPTGAWDFVANDLVDLARQLDA